ncbi:zinc-dependent alcohol dehydrogenase family protein [Phenylobacterium sp.]|uniref:zinc-dependent alcohol dehydrogenase family protein n=1 Tax=Phenylobacterium sp. TaxID=1871053 RepID=UPI0027315BC6|nr:zinc-dependent alcohol dehydrogenase family protein [Phenylobacterium sp.]MDP1599317.1 zinc-dependent alcohol dehydrogenase family protein [Phenylobacterium sp.]MDP3595285.1 zinc-dependent alcohol dehydrogenase family protein [Phenylobacterium sp.]
MLNDALWYRRFGQPAEALTLEAATLPDLSPGAVRVRMTAAPVNPSDLIPITGAYSHRIQPPLVAGYEGVGTVVSAEGAEAALIGRRVLPLRGAGTWQRYVDCDPAWMVPAPDDVDTGLAARGYINPLAAMLMLRRWPVRDRRVLVTAAGSSCANLLGQWALGAGASEVIGIYRSPQHHEWLLRLGVTPVAMSGDVEAAASRVDVAFDAVGGTLATRILAAMAPAGDFVSYGLLSGQGFARSAHGPPPQRFHLRDRLEDVSLAVWRGWFDDLWPLLGQAWLPEARYFALAEWREALALFETSGRQVKPMLAL